MSIREKLILYITVPVIAILIFAVSGFSDKYQKYSNSKNTIDFLSIVITLDNLMFELQKERGISTGLNETSSIFFQQAIHSQRILTDEAFRNYLQQRKAIDISFLNFQMREEISTLDKLLKKLPAIRSTVDKKNSGNPIQKYSELNTHGINLIQYLHLLTQDNKLAKWSDAYTNLLWLQERAGQERAALVWVFASKQMEPNYFRRIIGYIAAQRILIKSYNIKAPYEYRNLLKHKLSYPVNEKVERFRDVAINKIIRNELLSDLQTLIEFGGLLHNYKNYIVQGKVIYIENIHNVRSNVKNLVERYKAIPGKTQQDDLHLLIIEKTLDDYFNSIEKITTLLQQNATTQEIDTAAVVDDAPALQAVKFLRERLAKEDASIWWKTASERINLIKEVNDQLKMNISEQAAKNMQSTARSLWLFLSITLIALALSYILGKFLMYRLIGELTNISITLRNMYLKQRFDQPLTVSGKDEIGLMKTAFNQLISERQKFEEQLHLSAEVFANVTEAIMIADAKKRIKMINPAFIKMSGYKAEEIIGNDFFCLNESSLDEVTAYQIHNKLLKDSHWKGEVWNKKPDGKRYLISLNISVIKDNDNNITQYIGTFTDITQRKQHEESIWHQANYDNLTGLPNRNMCMDRLSQDLKTADRTNAQIALLFIDLDRFKLINDTLGHSAGDELLLEIALRLKHAIRKSDVISRLGGDEFVIILNNFRGIYEIEEVSKKILAALSVPVLFKDKSEAFTSGSIGIALFPHDGHDVETLMKQADTAMYQSKKRGRNKFTFFKKEMNAAVMQHMKIEQELRKAISKQQLYLYYQPIIALSTGNIIGAEALIRWQHPKLGLLMPNKFIGVAEDSGLIIPMGDWVIRAAAQQASEWNKAFDQKMKIAVNMSSRQFGDRNQRTIKIMQEIINEEELKPGMLEIEITESLLIDGTAETIESFQQIRELGVGISLDDFGTGYSSLSYLKHFPITTIKIDQSFIRDAVTNKKDAQLVQAMVTLSRSLDLDVVGEGIEDVEQLTFLKNLGCKYGQGYYFSHPLTAKEFEGYLRNGINL